MRQQVIDFDYIAHWILAGRSFGAHGAVQADEPIYEIAPPDLTTVRTIRRRPEHSQIHATAAALWSIQSVQSYVDGIERF
jgi:hypothetical protein